MHDRRIDGKAHTFGNYGALYLDAMTWYDHESNSLWSQPTGKAIRGPYEGVRLEMIPAGVVPWSTWKKEHPDTLIIDRGSGPTNTDFFWDPFATDYLGNFFIGVDLGDHSKGYAFKFVSEKVVVNDHIGDVPVLVYANPEDKAIHVFVRKLREQVLEFEWVNGSMRDKQTDTLWDPAKGIGVEGPLRRKVLKELPYSSTYGWAWVWHRLDTELYKP